MKFSRRLYLSICLLIACFLPNELIGQNNYNATLKAIEEKVYYYPQQAERMLDSLLQQRPIEIENDHRGDLNFLQGFIAYHKGEMDSALNHLETALMTFISQEKPKGQGKCYLLMGWISEGDNYLEQAKIYFYETIRLLNNQPGANTGLAYLGIARCKKILNETFSDDLNKGVEYLNTVGEVEFSLYAQFTYLMFNVNELGSTQKLLEVADSYLKIGLDNKVPNVYKILASYYRQIKKPDSALIYVDKAIRSFDNSYPGESLIPALHQLKGNIFYAQKDFENARKQYLLSLKLYESHGQMSHSFYAYHGLYNLDLKGGNYKGAVENLAKVNKYRNQANINQKQRMAKMIETTARVDLLNEQVLKFKKQKQRLFFSLALLSAIIVIILLIVFFKGREKKQKRKSLNADFQSLMALYNERLRAIELLENNREDLLKYQDEHLSARNIDDLYPELFRLIYENFNKLSKTELDYALMFTMDFPENEIAKLQNIQQPSIRKVKQRIREKLNLDSNIDLHSYFKAHLKL